jgi:hypothetical protein
MTSNTDSKPIIYPSVSDPLSHPVLQRLPEEKRIITSELYTQDSWAGPPIERDDLPFFMLPQMYQAIQAMMPFLNDQERFCLVAAYRMPEVQRILHEKNNTVAGITSPHCAGVAIAGYVTREESPDLAAHNLNAMINNLFSGRGSPNLLQSEFGWNFLRFQTLATNAGLVFPQRDGKPWHGEVPYAERFSQIDYPNAEQYLIQSR